jgi:hypothetical protein
LFIGKVELEEEVILHFISKKCKFISLSFRIGNPNIMMKLGKAKDHKGATTNVKGTYHRM